MTAHKSDSMHAILSAIVAPEWKRDPKDLQRLAALISLGPPSAMHGTAPVARTESRTEHGVHEEWITGEDARVRANVLTAWRDVSRIAGVPLPAPGKVG